MQRFCVKPTPSARNGKAMIRNRQNIICGTQIIRIDAPYHGSSPAMEAEGAVRLWSCSLEQYHLRYTKMVSDGDSKSSAQLTQLMRYGPEHPVQISIVAVMCKNDLGHGCVN